MSPRTSTVPIFSKVLLADLLDAPANGNQRFFAEHSQHNGHDVTANFDTCIERSGADPDQILHVHGSFSDAGGVEQLGARLRRIDAGSDG